MSFLRGAAVVNYSPEEFARALLNHPETAGINNVEELASRLGLMIREVDAVSFEGALVRIPQSRAGFIAVRRGIREAGRRQFTIAHEVAHFILPGHGQDECFCKSSVIESWRKDAVRKQEYEANRFASELLLPAKTLYPLVNNRDLTLTAIKTLALQFKTSLTATAVKCVQVAEERCALVCSVSQDVKWVCRSESFRYFIPHMRLGRDSLAGRLFESSSTVELEGEVFATAWIEGDEIGPDKKLWEESIVMPYYNSVLSLLTI
jgi:hypothetical protein